MASEGGGIVVATPPTPSPTPTTPRRLSSQHSTLRDSFIASDIADASNTPITNHNTNHTTSQRRVSNITLGAVLNIEKKSPPSNDTVVRTLLEIIHNDESLNIGGGSPHSRGSWKSFKEKLKRRKGQIRDSSRCSSSSMAIPANDVLPSSSSGNILMSNRNSFRNMNSLRSISIGIADTDNAPAFAPAPAPADEVSVMEVDSGGSPRSGGSFRLPAALAAEREHTRRRLSMELDEDGIDVSGQEEEEVGPSVDEVANRPVRMSLMDLLEETDRQAGISGPTYRINDETEVEEEEEAVEEEKLGKDEFCCCVCMVRHKGAAFIPCGHTFCRLCSRELFVQRGNCPLCNNFILEILNIF